MEATREEIWKDVVGYEGFYKVSNIGRILTKKRYRVREKIKKPQLRTGYPSVRLFKNSKPGIDAGVYYTIHRLVAAAFIPNPENKRQVNHKNGIKTDNRVDNLEWCTESENSIHAFSTGLRKSAVGAVYKRSNLTDESIKQIRMLSNRFTHRAIANLYGIGQPCITNIINRKSWKHVK